MLISHACALRIFALCSVLITLLIYNSKVEMMDYECPLDTKMRDSKETGPRCGEAHNVYKACVGITEGFKVHMCSAHRLYTSHKAAYVLHLHILHCDGV